MNAPQLPKRSRSSAEAPLHPGSPARMPTQIAVIGLGYVGLSLASAFGRFIPTIGFDIDEGRIRELRGGHDRTGETPQKALNAPFLSLTDDPGMLQKADFLIVTVPTPVDRARRPDLSNLIEASRLVARSLKPNKPSEPEKPNQPDKPDKPNKPIIVYESTVYPGCTEDVCIPVLERESGLRAGKDFKVGYSPERINPGDAEHTLETVVKVVAAQDDETVGVMEKVYGLVVKAGVYKAPDIRTAEAAKVIENIQRDLNIALMNELTILFHRLGLDTRDVLKAARTKWNFLPFDPGLVGGHCIPVDPYYLTHKAQEVGYHPEVILAGRRINDAMGVYVAGETVKLLIQAGKAVRGSRVLVLGVAFKEDVRDVRNTRVLDMVGELESHGIDVAVYDPLVDAAELQKLGLRPVPDPFLPNQPYKPDKPDQPNKLDQPNRPDKPKYDAVILAVPHQAFREKQLQSYLSLLTTEGGPCVLVDLKRLLPRELVEGAGVIYWSL